MDAIQIASVFQNHVMDVFNFDVTFRHSRMWILTTNMTSHFCHDTIYLEAQVSSQIAIIKVVPDIGYSAQV